MKLPYSRCNYKQEILDFLWVLVNTPNISSYGDMGCMPCMVCQWLVVGREGPGGSMS